VIGRDHADRQRDRRGDPQGGQREPLVDRQQRRGVQRAEQPFVGSRSPTAIETKTAPISDRLPHSAWTTSLACGNAPPEGTANSARFSAASARSNTVVPSERPGACRSWTPPGLVTPESSRKVVISPGKTAGRGYSVPRSRHPGGSHGPPDLPACMIATALQGLPPAGSLSAYPHLAQEDSVRLSKSGRLAPLVTVGLIAAGLAWATPALSNR